MKAILKTPFADFELDGAKPTEMFKAIAEAQEVFSQPCCGLCQGKNLRLVVRTVGDNDFYEMYCENSKCRAKLAFGQSKKFPGKLFPIRKLTDAGKPDRKTGKYSATNNGWTKFRGEAAAKEE